MGSRPNETSIASSLKHVAVEGRPRHQHPHLHVHLPGGPPEAAYRLVLEGRVELVTSRPLLIELGRVLTEKFGWENSRADDVVAQVARLSHVVRPTETVSEISADPSDDRVLEAAAEGGAEAIVSGDRHLLRLGTWRAVRIESAAKFLTRFQ